MDSAKPWIMRRTHRFLISCLTWSSWMGANRREYRQIIPPPRAWMTVRTANFLLLMFLYLSCFNIHLAERIWQVSREVRMERRLIQNQGRWPEVKNV